MGLNFHSFNDVDKLSSEEIYNMNYTYLNSGFTSLMRMMNCGRIFRYAYDCIIEDINGNKYIDFLGGYGSLNIGHSNPHVVETLELLKNKPNLIHIGFNPYTAVLASNLSNLTGRKLTRSFFCNSGAEAVESALKLGRAATGKSKLVYCQNSYHGKTFGALSVSGRNQYKKVFDPLLQYCEEVKFGDISSLEEKIKDKMAAAFILEPIQGEGGIIVPPDNYLRQVRELCTKYETLLIIDEVQTGLGRTGKMFAYEHEEIIPDILCLAKSLGGGIIPIGAYITTEDIYQKAYGEIDKCMLHSSTFGGNAYACSAAIAAIDVILKENLPQKTEEKGIYLKEKLTQMKEKYSVIKEIRGKGLLIGLEFNAKVQEETSGSEKAGGLNLLQSSYAAYTAGKLLNDYSILTAYSLNNLNVIRLEPPLTITYDQIDTLLNALNNILEKI